MHRYNRYPNFKEEENEAQRGCLRSPQASGRTQTQVYLVPKSTLSFLTALINTLFSLRPSWPLFPEYSLCPLPDHRTSNQRLFLQEAPSPGRGTQPFSPLEVISRQAQILRTINSWEAREPLNSILHPWPIHEPSKIRQSVHHGFRINCFPP